MDFIKAKKVVIGKNVTFGKNISIKVKGTFEIGDYSHLGSDTKIRGNNVKFGKHLYCSGGLKVGGGGHTNPTANLTIGDRCTIHNNFINVCKPVIIGDDVGLSPDVAILTHGYWQSVLDGFPAKFAGVTIGDNTIVGYRSIIMMGVKIAPNTVIGANSVVTKNISCEREIWAGNPARFIKIITKPHDKRAIILKMLDEYVKIAKYHKVVYDITYKHPILIFDEFRLNVETFEYSGKETEEIDDFRDFIRKRGIRIYTKRPFKSKFSFDE